MTWGQTVAVVVLLLVVTGWAGASVPKAVPAGAHSRATTLGGEAADARSTPHQTFTAVHPTIPPRGSTRFLPSLGSQGPTTAINGSVVINGTLISNYTTLSGNVANSGTGMTTGYTTTTGTAGYGATRVFGTLTLQQPATPLNPILYTNPGSALYLDPPSSTTSATINMQGDLTLGNPTTGDGFAMSQSGGTLLTVWANASGGIYGIGGATDLNSGSDIVVTNYGPGTITINCNIILICPVQVAPGSVYVPCILGICASASSSSITWSGPTDFSINGTVSTSSPGVYASFPESHVEITIPGTTGGNFSMVPLQGSPTISVTAGTQTPAAVTTYGDLLMTGGEQLDANVTVQGTFTAADHVFVNGTFFNQGGLTISGNIVSSGDQYFPHDLSLGPVFNVTTFPGQNITVQGHILGEWTSNTTPTIDVEGSMVTSGSLGLRGYFVQNSSVAQIEGNLSTTGLLVATSAPGGSILTRGLTEFGGNFLAEGNLTLPNTFLGGQLSATDCSLVGNGTTNLSGVLTVNGTTKVVNGTFSANGASTILGTIAGNKTYVLTGNATMETLWGENLSLTSTVEMGGVATVVGSVEVQGTIASNGTSTFNETTVDIMDAVTVQGTAYNQGSISVVGTTFFTGQVDSSGRANFPGMSLNGTFALAAAGGSVWAQGTSGVQGTVTLSGTLEITPPTSGASGIFHEDGFSSIYGDLSMTGTVIVTGDTQLTTTNGAQLFMWGNIDLGTSARIEGDVNVTGEVTINGTATLGGGSVVIAGALEQIGEVFSSGDIQLTGEASFQGSVSTYGTTVLPGITTVGTLSMPSTDFIVRGSITLIGSTDADGNVIVNSSGYFVQGSDTIHGRSTSTGTFSNVGSAHFTGYALLGDASQFGTYLKIVGTMNTGSLSLTGTTILPNDEVYFPTGANISGSGTMNGTLTGAGTSVNFVGSSVVYGTVTTSGLPQITGPIVLSLLGGYFAITLGTEIYWFLGMVVVAIGCGLVATLLWIRRKLRHIIRPPVPVLYRLLALIGAVAMLAGSLGGLVGGFLEGTALANGPMNQNVSGVAALYEISAAVITAGFVLWVIGGLLAWRARRRVTYPVYPPAPYPVAEVPIATSPWGAPYPYAPPYSPPEPGPSFPPGGGP